MKWSPLKTQRLVFKHRGCREPCPPRDIYFNGDQIIPMDSKSLKTKCKSLGVLISKNLIFLDQINRVTNSIRSMTTLMNRNFYSKTDELLEIFYKTYIIPCQIYCCQIWQPGAEKYLRLINNAVRNYWKLSKSGGPPKDFLEPSLHYILMDLVFTHKIYHGKSTLDFDTLFKICETNTRQGANKLLKLPKWKLQSGNLF